MRISLLTLFALLSTRGCQHLDAQQARGSGCPSTHSTGKVHNIWRPSCNLCAKNGCNHNKERLQQHPPTKRKSPEAECASCGRCGGFMADAMEQAKNHCLGEARSNLEDVHALQRCC